MWFDDVFEKKVVWGMGRDGVRGVGGPHPYPMVRK